MTFTLPRLDRLRPVVDRSGNPSIAFHIFWDQLASAIEDHEATQATILADLAAAQADIIATQADLAAAQADIIATQADIIAQQAQILEALANMPDVNDVHIAADSSGIVLADELPRVVETFRYSDTATDVTSSATWAFDTDNSGITASITDGLLEITDITADTQVTVTSTYNGIDKSRAFTVYLDQAPQSLTTSGSTNTSDLAQIVVATMAPMSGPLAVTVAASGNVYLNTGNLTVRTASTGGVSVGTLPVYGIWQRFIAGVWTDIGTEVFNIHSCREQATGTIIDGNLKVIRTVSGLTPAATEQFRLEARNDSGTRHMTLSGTISVSSS